MITNDSIASVNEMILANRRVTWEIIHELNMSKGTVHTIIHQHLAYSKMCAARVQKNTRLLIIRNVKWASVSIPL